MTRRVIKIKNASRLPNVQADMQSRRQGSAALLIVGVVVILIALFVVGFLAKQATNKDLTKMQDETVNAVRKVYVVDAVPAEFKETGTLPGNIDAIQYASIYARVDGYLKSRMVDIGDHVKEGQILAEIDTPTVDAQLAQAREDLAEAKSALETAKASLKEAMANSEAADAKVQKAVADQEYTAVTAKRWVSMASRGAVSLQSRDEKVTADKSQNANVEAAKAEQKASVSQVAAASSQVVTAKARVNAQTANVARLVAQQSFKWVRAPFDGIITLRKVDPGALITQGSSSSNLELFQMGQIDHLRIYVNAPQSLAAYLKPGLKAAVSIQALPGRSFDGTVSNVSAALDPQTRTLQVEVRLENQDHTLLPGMYAQVKLSVPRPDPWIRIPGTALVPKSDGTYVCVVGEGNKAHFQKVEIGRDFGDYLEISAGLADKAVVIAAPPVDLLEGEHVDPHSLSEIGKQSHAEAEKKE